MITVLMGANRREAAEWCDARRIPRSELGRTVFPSSADPAVLRGRRDRVDLVYGAGILAGHHNFAEWLEGATVINATITPREESRS